LFAEPDCQFFDHYNIFCKSKDFKKELNLFYQQELKTESYLLGGSILYPESFKDIEMKLENMAY